MKSKKMLASGLTLALILGGAISAYAQDSTTGNVLGAPTIDQQQTTPSAKDPQHEGKWPSREMESKRAGMKDRAGESFKQLSTILGMSVDEIKTQLKAGKSISDLAKDKGIAEQDLIKQLVAGTLQKVDNAVKAGKLTQDKADQIKKSMPDRIQKLVQHKGLPEFRDGKFGHDRPGLGMMPKLDVIAGWFNISKDDLTKDLKAGKTLADIASQHGMTKDKLIAKIQDEMKPKIDKFVSSPMKHEQKDNAKTQK